MIIFIAAHDKNRGIGFHGRISWPRMQADRERLHALTDGKTIVMGERTYREYKDVQHAFNTNHVIVLSCSKESLEGAEVVTSLNEIIKRSEQEDFWVIGGGSVFEQLLPYAQKMYLTEVDTIAKADTYFPAYDTAEWRVVGKKAHQADKQNPFNYTFLDLERGN